MSSAARIRPKGPQGRLGSSLDLAIAVGVLVATNQLPPSCTDGLSFCGELGLNGSLRHVPGMIALADATAPLGMVVPLCDVREAALVRGDEAHGVSSLADLTEILRDRTEWPAMPPPGALPPLPDTPDLADVKGQPVGRHALEVAAAGRHHLLMVGPPGSGKTMLAERLPGLLPPLTLEESLTVTRVHSAAGCVLSDGALVSQPPFRAPHHRASIVALVGGGSWSLRPGEISLATHGVLFLDESSDRQTTHSGRSTGEVPAPPREPDYPVIQTAGGSWSLRPGEVSLATHGVRECPSKNSGCSSAGTGSEVAAVHRPPWLSVFGRRWPGSLYGRRG
ncbi:MAG TPA: ATP-binding protein, partial [Acidimicrobiales bacterium]|nr:ATP-binding protein [Acidimicrobiales bacterium]